MKAEARSIYPASLIAFYGVMALIGLALMLWRGPDRAFHALAFPGEDPLYFLALTTLLLLAVHHGSRLWLRSSVSARRCGEDVRQLMGGLSRREVLWLALASGVGEEMLFRGYLLNETGLWVSSILFGLIHIPPNRNWLLWPVFAMAMGVLLGALCLAANSLLWAILLHAGVNYLNLRLILFGRRPSGGSAAENLNAPE